jgi:phosphatidylserine decarboxylase
MLTIFFLVFFRDPEREIGDGFVACADGRIREIIELDDKDVGICFKVSTFMNITNVHVNRIPIAGRIVEIQHFSGFHIPAFKKESENNERVVTIIETKIGNVKIVQIAGTLARRIIPYIKRDQKVDRGDRLGLIRLGSRVDVFIPKRNVKKLCINVGDRVFAGEDIIAEIND